MNDSLAAVGVAKNDREKKQVYFWCQTAKKTHYKEPFTVFHCAISFTFMHIERNHVRNVFTIKSVCLMSFFFREKGQVWHLKGWGHL